MRESISSITAIHSARISKTSFDLLFYVPPFFVISVLVAASIVNSIAYVRNFVDDTAYHIPVAVEIARHHNPYYVDVYSTFTSFWFPAGAESLVAVIVSITHDIYSTNLSGSVFFILFLLVSYKFAGVWTKNFRVRLLCVMLTGIIPILFAQTRAFYIDIHINFLVYLSLYLYAVSVIKEDANYSYFGLGVSVLSASVKYHGLIFCAILVPVGIFCILRSKKRLPVWNALIFVLICVIFTSGWYVRNLLLKGNPIYPLALPEFLQTCSTWIGLPYEGIDFPNMSPQTQLPYPLIPRTLSHYNFVPHMTDDAFGLMFPVSLVMLVIAVFYVRHMPVAQRHAFWLTLAASIMIIIALPFYLTVPRYILFIPAVAGLWPSILASCTRENRRIQSLMYAIVSLLSLSYILANFIGTSGVQTVSQEAITLLAEGRDSNIVHFDFIEEGHLRIGYVNGRYGFIASLYDRKLTNQLIQLHYQDYIINHGDGFTSPKEFVKYIDSLKLDYICIFDTEAPGAQIIETSFPDKTFVEDVFK